MGSWQESLDNLLHGKARGDLPLPLAQGERLVMQTPAAINPGSLKSFGGTLFLTDERLVFVPHAMNDVAVVLGAILKAAGAPAWAAGLPQKLLDAAGNPVALGWKLTEISDVTAGDTRTLVVRGVGGVSTEMEIAATLWTPKWSAKNGTQRDDLVQAIKGHLHAVG
jgi:hypothetical protein